MRAIEDVLASGLAHTPDLGGVATTNQSGQAIREQLQKIAARS
jgi:isocitrate/isopropylmalate dehydrogenase